MRHGMHGFLGDYSAARRAFMSAYAVSISVESAAIESYVDVRFEGVYIAERGIPHTHGRMSIMQQLPNILSAPAHSLEPPPRCLPQLLGMFIEPQLNGDIKFGRTGEPK